MSEVKRTIKGLFLQMRLSEHFEERVAAEERITNMYNDLQSKLSSLEEQAQALVEQLNWVCMNSSMSADDKLIGSHVDAHLRNVERCKQALEAYEAWKRGQS